MSDVYRAVVDCIRSSTNPERNCPPWATVGNITGKLYPAVEPKTVRDALGDLKRDDNRSQAPVIVRFDDPRFEPPIERVVLLEATRVERAAKALTEHPDVARDVCAQLAEQNVVPKEFIGAINIALGRVEA